MSAKLKPRTLVAEVSPEHVRFTEVDRPEGGEPVLTGMLIVDVDDWRKAGAPLRVEAVLTPLADVDEKKK